MVGLVIVSHSAALAGGVVDLAREMGGEEVAIEAAGGMAEPEGAIGTDPMVVQGAIERAAGPDGVLVLMDLGSAVMSAEMAVEMVAMEHPDLELVLCEAPLVEGAVAAAARAGAGAPLDEVAAEARAALGMKAVQLGLEVAAPAAAPAGAAEDGDALEARLPVGNPLGLHARPAARFVETAARFDAAVTVRDETNGKGPADAKSLSALVMLGVRQGDTLLVRAGGPQAQAALDALHDLAAGGYGDGAVAAPAQAAAAAAAAAPEPEPEPEAVAPPAAGDRLTGIAVAPGIVIGPARRPAPPAPAEVPDAPAGPPAEERAALDRARAAARHDLEAARDHVAGRTSAAEAAIFDAHLLLLDDAALLDPARQGIDGGESAARAWHAAVTTTAASWRGLDDPYLRERAADVEDVGDRVLRHLVGAPPPTAGAPAEAGVLVVGDLTPGEAAALDPGRVEGLALARGGATSHAAILSRALGIPSAAGLGAGALAIADGTMVVLDGGHGTLEVDPGPERLAELERARDAAAERNRRALARARDPARTRDGTTIEVMANVGAPRDAADAVALGADGVGLLRTEFLFLDRDDAPSEDEQVAVYEEIAAALEGRPLVLRTLDAGADKPLRFLPQEPEENPFLGVRGIRLALARPELLATQLRAALTVARRHPVQVMFPMVATLGEYRAARAVLEAEREAVGAPAIPVGVMVEVPAVALAAERFAREVDFLSIGTNDLTQYTMAAERGNDAVAALLGGPQPAVLRLAGAVADGAAAHGRWAGVCGELAGDPAAAVLLAGLGIRELSMAAPLIPAVKEALRGVTLDEARSVALQALELDDAAAVAELAAPLVAAG